jgi:putative SOS response-associated peptidase YedK
MILRPYSADLMRVYPVGPRVGNVRNNDADLLDEISVAA